MDKTYWYKRWQNDKCFVIENDRLKKKSYIYTPFPKTNIFGFQDGDVRRLIASDIIARYQRMQDKNVLFPTGYHSLCNSSFVENKKYSNILNDDISNIFKSQMLALGIGINESKDIDMRHKEFLGNLQYAFIELYEKKYIEYKYSKVYFDEKLNKIYDYLNEKHELPIMNHKCFVLEFESLIPEILKDINRIQCSDKLKKKLINGLRPKTVLKLELAVSNGNLLPVEIKEPQFLGGVSYIFLNPEFIDITHYVHINEYRNVMNYLENGLDTCVYTGLTAQNPLTGNAIPIYISTIYNKDAYLGIPNVDSNDNRIALESGIEIINILDNELLMNSDMLDGLNIAQAKNKIIDLFLDAEIAKLETTYENHSVNLSSLDNFGPLFPFLEDKQTGKIASLKGYLPYAFSSKLRPILSDDVDILGTTMNGTINNLFTEGLAPILSVIHDDIGAIESIFSRVSKDDLADWLPIDYAIVDEESIYSSILMPIIFYNIIKKESGYDLPNIFNRVLVSPKTLDSSRNIIKRSSNNLIDMTNILDMYYPDTVRLYCMATPLNYALGFDANIIKELDKTIRYIENALESCNDVINYDYDFDNFITACNKALEDYDLYEYAKCIYQFINKTILRKSLNKKQALAFIKVLYPLMPFVSEEIYKNIFNGRYSIINEEWPK
ncbi:MAG: class I tRNA ligase family protein [Acholeplasmatales bacterium]|nr:class I tRNA ligase family protein [Acholeplasmatales bacterium]